MIQLYVFLRVCVFVCNVTSQPMGRAQYHITCDVQVQ